MNKLITFCSVSVLVSAIFVSGLSADSTASSSKNRKVVVNLDSAKVLKSSDGSMSTEDELYVLAIGVYTDGHGMRKGKIVRAPDKHWPIALNQISVSNKEIFSLDLPNNHSLFLYLVVCEQDDATKDDLRALAKAVADDIDLSTGHLRRYESLLQHADKLGVSRLDDIIGVVRGIFRNDRGLLSSQITGLDGVLTTTTLGTCDSFLDDCGNLPHRFIMTGADSRYQVDLSIR